MIFVQLKFTNRPEMYDPVSWTAVLGLDGARDAGEQREHAWLCQLNSPRAKLWRVLETNQSTVKGGGTCSMQAGFAAAQPCEYCLGIEG